MRIRWITVALSVLIVVSGWLGSQTLMRVDQDLRVIYAEYTLAATDLGHLSGELIRYRTSVIRAVEADNHQDFQRILASLPHKRQRVENAIERFIEATNDASRGKLMDAREIVELKAVQEKIEAYMSASRQALRLMERRWNVASTAEARRLQEEAREYLAKNAGTRYLSVTFELDQLLEAVAAIAGKMKTDADFTLRMATVGIIAICLTLGLLVLAIPKGG